MTAQLSSQHIGAPLRSVDEPREYAQGAKARGAVFTRQPVVDFILDLVGYRADAPLWRMGLLEPSFGDGRFVLAAVDRLLRAWRGAGGKAAEELRGAIRAVELDPQECDQFRRALTAFLTQHGLSAPEAQMLANSWLVNADFLLTGMDFQFDFVVGNPPYVRQENIAAPLLKIYRAAYPTMVGRADLYVAFMERSLDLLKPGGKLSFICADAWIKNDYGRGIRQKIANGFNLVTYVDMYGMDAFEESVGAYPSITVIGRGPQGAVRVAHARDVSGEYLTNLAQQLNDTARQTVEVTTIEAVRGSQPWLISASPMRGVIADLEARFPTLTQAGCRVGIGVATGADKVFVGPFDQLEVEDNRKLPLATNKDARGGDVVWSGMGVVNPWSESGGLVDLGQYPRLAAYLGAHRELLSQRHTAKRDPDRRWYKTIDRISASLTSEPKLLIPDIRGNGNSITFDPGSLYPHHNLYYITSDRWDLRALQALLRSGIAHLFVSAYSVKIGGGYLRFQAQNLRRIRVPHWEQVSVADRAEMKRAGIAGEKLSVALLERIYQLDAGALLFMEEGQTRVAQS